ncbi:hypothetical protein BGX31_005272 [Mortierella sp. GBA43]|nr:hypothetical protein BGX31_005272 [Mortierella sp. GBA43]
MGHVKKAPKTNGDIATCERITTLYLDLANLLDQQGHKVEAQAFYKKAEKWRGSLPPGHSPRPSRPGSIVDSFRGAFLSTTVAHGAPSAVPSPRPSLDPLKQTIFLAATIPQGIFSKNMRPPTIDFHPPEPDSRLKDTPQLACCLELLKGSYEPEDILDQTTRSWLETTRNDADEKDRLMTLATDVVRAFKRDELKDEKAVAEIVCLAPALECNDFRYLAREFYSGIDQSGLLDLHQLEGLGHLIQGTKPGYLEDDDLVKILELLSTRLEGTHKHSPKYLYQLTLVVSRVLDAMVDADVKGLSRERLHEPLKSYLDELQGSPDAYLVYQAAYAYQALLCVPDDETLWKATLRRTGKVIKGVAGLVSAVKGLDLIEFVEGLKDIQQGLAGASEIAQLAKNAYVGAKSLAEGGQGFFSSLKEGSSFDRRCAWYPALRGAEALISEGQLDEFKKLVCEAPCRHDPAFQWGVCQLLGELGANPDWDPETRQGAVAFLGEIYRNDTEWGHQSACKQWILNILMHLSSGSGRLTRGKYEMKILR